MEREALPIFEHLSQILELIKQNLFVVITGETGSGKSTQLPQYAAQYLTREELVELGRQSYYRFKKEGESECKLQAKREEVKVIVTQPRRVATIQMAKRVSEEQGTKLGQKVGYAIRFQEQISTQTQIKYVTDGILLQECLSDSLLMNYDIVILDEAHERSLFTDVLFTLVKQAVLARQGTLRLVVTSATLNTALFSSFLFNCPVLSVSGRCFPVVVQHVGDIPEQMRVEQSVKAAINIHLQEEQGDVLVFLTGFEECEQACLICYEKLNELKQKGREIPPLLIIALYGSQKSSEQQKAFLPTPPGARKVIFATNIAQTSLTVDGVAFVIDGGHVKQKSYNPKTGIQMLQIVPVSKVQAVQRTGRAGRTQSGKCYRLYSEEFYKEHMIDETIPEIHRVNLDSVVLFLLEIGVSDILEFQFIDPPDRENILLALRTLYFLRAMDKKKVLTPLGRAMAHFPISPCYSCSLLAAMLLHCEREVATIVALLSTENIWRPLSRTAPEPVQRRLQRVKESFLDRRSDLLGLLNIYREWKDNSFSEKWVNDHFLQSRALKQAQNIRQQLLDNLKKTKLQDVQKYIDPSLLEQFTSEEGRKSVRILKSLSCGLFINSAKKIVGLEQGLYTSALTKEVLSVGESCTFAQLNEYPEWIIFSDVAGLRSKKAVVRMASTVEYRWIQRKLPMLGNVDYMEFGKLDLLPEYIRQFINKKNDDFQAKPIDEIFGEEKKEENKELKRDEKAAAKEKEKEKKAKLAQAKMKYLARKFQV